MSIHLYSDENERSWLLVHVSIHLHTTHLGDVNIRILVQPGIYLANINNSFISPALPLSYFYVCMYSGSTYNGRTTSVIARARTIGTRLTKQPWAYATW